MNTGLIAVEFPLRGEWLTEVSPLNSVPSHGTNRFGLRYAFDFIQVDFDQPSHPTHTKNSIDYFLKGVPLNSYFCFGKPVYSPFSGEIILVKNNTADGRKASWLHDQRSAIRHSLFFNPENDGFETIAGNYVIVKKEGVYAVFCHLQQDTIAVKVGDLIQKGQLIGHVGHSGNSTEPHLHFHLMDSIEIEKAQGLPFVFEEYEKYQDGTWTKITNEIPKTNDRIRFIKEV